MKKTQPATTTTSKVPATTTQTKGFVAANYVRPGVTEAEIVDIKAAFDLFDTDQGGSIDTNCTFSLTQNSRPQWSPSVSMARTPSSSK